MRCVQFADGTTQSQVASLSATDCPATLAAQADVCSQPQLKYESVYELGNQCINKGTGISLNCKQTVLQRDRIAAEGTPEPFTAGTPTTPIPTSPSNPSLSSGAIAGIAGGIAVLLLATVAIAFVVYRRRQKEEQREITISSPLKKNREKSESTASLEAAVNDLI